MCWQRRPIWDHCDRKSKVFTNRAGGIAFALKGDASLPLIVTFRMVQG
jgi:hypothetical protein